MSDVKSIQEFKKGVESLYLKYLELWPDLFQLIVGTLNTPLIRFDEAFDFFEQRLYNNERTNELVDQWLTLQLIFNTDLAHVYRDGLSELGRMYESVVKESVAGKLCNVTSDDLDDDEFMTLLAFRVYLSTMAELPQLAMDPQ